jgi:uncharacterized protein (DUF58 family)
MAPRPWLQLLIIVFVGGTLLNFPWLVYFSTAVVVVMALSSYWRNHALDKIKYTRSFHYTRGFPGEKTTVSVTVENNKLLPVSWLSASDTWPDDFDPEGELRLSTSHIPKQGYLVNLYSLRWHQRITRSFTVLFHKRGIYPIGPLMLQAGDFFGMYDQSREVDNLEYLTVFPEIVPLENLKLPAENPFGDRQAVKPLFEDPSRPMGIRPYHPEDGFRRIHWPATARTGELQVKVYQPVIARVMVICLNVTTETHYWMGYSPEILEQLVKISATLVYQGTEDGYAVGLFSNGCLAHADQPFRIQPGKSANQLALLLGALAGVTPFVSAAFETFLIRSMTDIPFGSTLVIVSAFVTESLQDTLIRLRRYRPNITLISLEETPPPDLPGIHIVHLPFVPEETRRRS